jgi:hypothetical protein
MMQKRVYFLSRSEPLVVAVGVHDLSVMNPHQWARIPLSQYRSMRRDSRQKARLA